MESIKKENNRDIISAFIAVPWQLILFATGMVMVFREWNTFFILFTVLLILSFLLYKIWYKNLDANGAQK
jgi:membrane protein implicated in regulation of membrane protease activity